MAEEKRFEAKIKKYLDGIGAWHVKYHGSAMSAIGIPDLLICLNGFFIAIEVKASRGKPSELQKYHVLKINEAGGIGIILYPEGFEDFKKICEGVRNCNYHIQELNVLKLAHSSTKCVISPKLKR